METRRGVAPAARGNITRHAARLEVVGFQRPMTFISRLHDPSGNLLEDHRGLILSIYARIGAGYLLAGILAGLLLHPFVRGWKAAPAVLALAIHNGGILGRLYGDTFENLPPGAPRALRTLGAGRGQLGLPLLVLQLN